MIPVDAYASRPHYFEHLLPVWLALPVEARGRLVVSHELDLPTVARRCGGPIERGFGLPADPDRLAMVAAYIDEQACPGRPVVLIEHGAGQHYGPNRNPAFPGGLGRGRVVLFVAPHERVARRWHEQYPSTPVAVVGSPKMDRWHVGERRPVDVLRNGRRPRVVVSFKWDCPVEPESRHALEHYRDAFADLARRRRELPYDLYGHAHPRASDVVSYWHAVGVPFLREFGDVLDTASLYVVDSSSTAYEFASLDRPVLLLNAPWYRREVEHGLRFWSESGVGIQVDGPETLDAAILLALADRPGVAATRRETIRRVYAHTDGQAAGRAAAAIVALTDADLARAWRIPVADDPFAPPDGPRTHIRLAVADLVALRQEAVFVLRARGIVVSPALRTAIDESTPDDLATIIAGARTAEVAVLNAELAEWGDVDVHAATVGVGDPGVDDVPDGTVAEVEAWVAGDPARALRALAIEEARLSPRSTLLGHLRVIVDTATAPA